MRIFHLSDALYEELAALPEDLPRHEDLATLQYTGGTTGLPKGVNILHRQIAYNIAQREAWLPTRRNSEVVLCVMPLFHVSAVSMSLYLSLHARGELVLMRRFDAANAACKARANAEAENHNGSVDYDRCMAEAGWRRP